MRKVLKPVVSLVLIGVALWLLDYNRLMDAVSSLGAWAFVVTVAVCVLKVLVTGLRWDHLVRPLGHTDSRDNLQHYLYGTFLNNFTPANIGGDVYRYVLLTGRASSRMSSFAVLLRERLLGFIGFFSIFLLGAVMIGISGVAMTGNGHFLVFWVAVCAAVGIVATSLGPMMCKYAQDMPIVASRPRLALAIEEMGGAFRFKSLRGFLLLMGLTYLGLFLWVLAVRVVAEDVGATIPWDVLAVIVVLVELARLAPISVQGIGVRESMYAYSFQIFTYSPELGFVVGTVAYVALTLSLVLSGCLGWLMMNVSPKLRSQR